MPFKFRLESVLRYRKFHEQVAMKELKEARTEYERVRETIGLLSGERAEAARRCGELSAGGVDIPTYRHFSLYIQKLDRNIERTYRRLKDEERMVERRETALRRAQVQKRILQTMKELKRQRYVTDSDREDQRRLDEMIIMRSRMLK